MNATLRFPTLDLAAVRRFYAEGHAPAALLREIYRRVAERGDDAVWIYLPPLEELLEQVPSDPSLPLYGVPFAVKDNIDVAGWPTTAGCREFAYTAKEDAAVVARLRRAGAIPIGKTNLDQFATGLVGTRSPFGIPRSVYSGDYISGGSSSGSAVAVAAGLAAFALGTDTAGSGRVPAAFNGIVGLKPSCGLLSTRGVVPACRSLDCVSIFSMCVEDALEITRAARGFDPADPFSRAELPSKAPAGKSTRFRIGVPAPSQLEFHGDTESPKLFQAAIERLRALGHECVEFDFAPFRDTANLLYSGPWVAERLAAIEPFFREHADALHPITRKIIGGASALNAVETFKGLYELKRLRRLADLAWEKMDAMLLPTTSTIYTVEQVLADPVALNTNLGFYTNFVNLLDLCGIAVPAGERNGLPFGVTLIAPAFHDDWICRLGAEYLGEPLAASDQEPGIDLAVVGAHLSRQPLNHQLTDRKARLMRSCKSAPHYRLYALANTTPPKPGLVRDPDFAGPGIELEVWRLSPEAFGDFVSQVPQPMVIGTVELEDGTLCKGFLCEPCACHGATEITHLGGWRRYLAQ